MEQEYDVVASYLKERTHYRPTVGIICGTGLSGLSSSLTDTQTFYFRDIPNFPQVTVSGHTAELVFGRMGEVTCVCMRGRFHLYEGNSMARVALPVRVMRLLGVKILVVTNASGGLNGQYQVGDIALIEDHIGMPTMGGLTPLLGLNDDRLGPRFFSMHDAYDATLQRLTRQAAEQLGLSPKLRTGAVYCYVAGPSYETPAECRFLRQLGDVVGMSTVPEVLAARHCGMRVLGLSLVTAAAITEANAPLAAITHEEVLEITHSASRDVERLLHFVLQHPDVRTIAHEVCDVDGTPRLGESATAGKGGGGGCACVAAGREAMTGPVLISVACAAISVACLLYTLRRRV